MFLREKREGQLFQLLGFQMFFFINISQWLTSGDWVEGEEGHPQLILSVILLAWLL